jgi:hypothetical protein
MELQFKESSNGHKTILVYLCLLIGLYVVYVRTNLAPALFSDGHVKAPKKRKNENSNVECNMCYIQMHFLKNIKF